MVKDSVFRFLDQCLRSGEAQNEIKIAMSEQKLNRLIEEMDLKGEDQLKEALGVDIDRPSSIEGVIVTFPPQIVMGEVEHGEPE